jgi:hypothetical protein
LGAIIKIASATKNSGATINYIARNGKLEKELQSGYGCSDDYASARKQMKVTRELFSKTTGRQSFHLVQSFDEADHLTPQQSHQLGKEFVEKLAEKYPNREIFMATHTDQDNLHNHIVINSVDFTDGKKMDIKIADIYDLQTINDTIAEKHALTPLKAVENNVYKSEIKAYEQTGKQYERDKVKEKIQLAREQSTSMSDFTKRLADQGVQRSWQMGKKGQNTREKYVTTDHAGKEWSFSARKLGAEFKGETIEHAILGQEDTRDKENRNTERIRELTDSVRETAERVRAEQEENRQLERQREAAREASRDDGPSL